MTRYTNKQRHDIYKVKAKLKPTIKTSVTIPKGNSKQAIIDRKSIVKNNIPNYYGVYKCPALNADVVVNSTVTLSKTKSEGSKTAKSTILSLILTDLIGKAELIYKDKPKNNSGQKQFSEMYVLVAVVKGVGYAKLTIGKYKDDVLNNKASCCCYCVKHISIHEIKNKKRT